jgi:ABC-type lipoprotein export system ATPase subunit
MSDIAQDRLYSGTLVAGQGIERSFTTGGRTLEVLRGLDIEVQAGEMMALYGPSGSGKTTLLNIIGALDTPNAGTVQVMDKEVSRLGEGRRSRVRRRHIGYIFQTYSLLQTYTSAENVDLALRLPGMGYFERKRRVRSALDAVGLSAWADHMPSQLSGGQRQRVAIARALALRPAIVLADEPTSGLDSRTSRRVLALFQGIARAQGTAFVIVSHDPVVADFVDRAFNLEAGLLVARTTTSVYTDERLKGESP